MLNVELDPVKCRITIKALLLINLNLCLSVMLDNLLHSFTWTSLLTYSTCTWTNRCKLTRQYSTSMTVVAYFIKILVYASTNVCNKAIFVKFMQLYHTTPLAWSTRVDLILIVKLYTTSLRHMVQWGTRQLGPRTTRTETSRPVSENNLARKRGLVGPYVKTTRPVC
jgi:hypothetical protein